MTKTVVSVSGLPPQRPRQVNRCTTRITLVPIETGSHKQRCPSEPLLIGLCQRQPRCHSARTWFIPSRAAFPSGCHSHQAAGLSCEAGDLRLGGGEESSVIPPPLFHRQLRSAGPVCRCGNIAVTSRQDSMSWMDVEVSAGRDSTWRRAAAASAAAAADDDDGGGGGGGGRGGMEAQIVPLELYDSARAKIEANLRWLFAKAYGIDNVPSDQRNPFYTDQYEQEHIKPPIIRLLLSGELYCRVCGLILHAEQAASLQSHQSVIQALSRKGLYVLEADNTPVSDLDLSSAPLKMSSHIHLIDALMMAYMVEMISIEKVVSSVKRFSNFSASKELPFDMEDAMLFWINKVNIKMREITEKELKMKQHLLESSSHQKSPSKWYWKLVPVRYRRDHLSGRTLQHFPLLDDLLKDVCDGLLCWL
ncbi:unnamed protein product [Pleuronectes platessa]|uniref:CASAMP N-terminal domain-containing protein n=1 Tax=Pleuronectes platessa TaxID=8262 RepID=A0A9N7URR0_PLEPL|nr:unnamed protein product [Pleuronectes platessa]